MRTKKHLCAALAIVVLTTTPVMGAMAAMAAVVYDLTFDTSAWSGAPGYLDLQFLPLDTSAPPAQASLSLFSTNGVLGAGAVANGAVSGVLPATLVFQNTNTFNAWLQPLSYGTALAFRLTLSGDWENAVAGSATTFSATLLDDTWGALAPSTTIDLFPGGNTVVNAGVSAITAVPLPAAWMLMLAGLSVLGGAMRNRAVAAK